MGDKGLLLRQAAQKQGALGRRHGGDALHHILRHPDQANMVRHPGFHAVGQDDRFQPRMMGGCLLQQLGTVGYEQSSLLPGLPGGQQLFHLLQQGIFPGGDSFFHGFSSFRALRRQGQLLTVSLYRFPSLLQGILPEI